MYTVQYVTLLLEKKKASRLETLEIEMKGTKKLFVSLFFAARAHRLLVQSTSICFLYTCILGVVEENQR
jgi:hypothetical protein